MKPQPRDIQNEQKKWANEVFREKEGLAIAEEITRFIASQYTNGDPAAFDDMIPHVQGILRRHYGPLLPLLGMVEEVGELAHAVLKRHQGIRQDQDHDAAIRDASADIDIYHLDFANREGFDKSENTAEVWDQVVSKRTAKTLETGEDR